MGDDDSVRNLFREDSIPQKQNGKAGVLAAIQSKIPPIP